MQPYYDPEAVQPMWEELANVGVRPLTTSDEVDEAMKAPGTTLVVVNSVCGCAAGSARPGVCAALQNSTIPDQMTTVFAGMDREAVESARGYMKGIPPSSPAIALFKDGELVHALERHQIEGMNVDMVVANLVSAFDQHCSAKGPSVPRDVYESNIADMQCGSGIPLYSLS